MTTRKSQHGYLRPLNLLLILLAFGLRTYRLGYQELRGDETFGYFFSLPNFGQIIERTFELQEPHPVASYFVQSAWLDWVGHSEYALRFPSAWFSVLAVALIMRLAWALGFTPATIAFSGLLLAASPYAIWHSQDARMYSMSLALTVASSWFFVALMVPHWRQHSHRGSQQTGSPNTTKRLTTKRLTTKRLTTKRLTTKRLWGRPSRMRSESGWFNTLVKTTSRRDSFELVSMSRCRTKSPIKGEPANAPSTGLGPSGAIAMRINYPLLILGYLLVTLLALHTHYFSAFVVVSQNIFILLWFVFGCITHKFQRAGGASADAAMLSGDRYQEVPYQGVGGWGRLGWVALLQWFGLQLALSLAYLPWLIPARAILTGYGGNGDSPGLVAMLGRALRTFAFGETVSDQWLWPILAAVALIILIIGWPSSPISPERSGPPRTLPRVQVMLYLLIYMFVPLFATWISALQRPIFDERYLVAAAPPFLLLVGYGLTAGIGFLDGISVRQTGIARWGLSAISVGIAALIGVGMILSLLNHYTSPTYSKTIGWRQLARTMDQLLSGHAVDSSRLVQNYPDPTLWYYYRGEVLHTVLPPGPLDAAGSAREVEGFLATAPEPIQHVVLALQPASNWDNNGIAQQALAAEFTLIAETVGASWPIQIYARPPEYLEPTAGGKFVNGLQLSHANISPQVLKPGSLLSIHLGWRAHSDTLVGDVTLSGNEKLFLHLIGPDGSIIAQNDKLLYEGIGAGWNTMAEIPIDSSSKPSLAPQATASYGILVPLDAPTGEYRLFAGLYDPSLSGAPRINTTSNTDAILISSLDVETN